MHAFMAALAQLDECPSWQQCTMIGMLPFTRCHCTSLLLQWPQSRSSLTQGFMCHQGGCQSSQQLHARFRFVFFITVFLSDTALVKNQATGTQETRSQGSYCYTGSAASLDRLSALLVLQPCMSKMNKYKLGNEA